MTAAGGGVARTLIEGSRVSAACPRVRKDDLLRGVGDGRREFATLEKRDVETQVEHVLKAVVHVNATVLNRKKQKNNNNNNKKQEVSVGDQCPGREKRLRGEFLQEILGPFEGVGVKLVGVGGSPH